MLEKPEEVRNDGSWPRGMAYFRRWKETGVINGIESLFLGITTLFCKWWFITRQEFLQGIWIWMCCLENNYFLVRERRVTAFFLRRCGILEKKKVPGNSISCRFSCLLLSHNFFQTSRYCTTRAHDWKLSTRAKLCCSAPSSFSREFSDFIFRQHPFDMGCGLAEESVYSLQSGIDCARECYNAQRRIINESKNEK